MGPSPTATARSGACAASAATAMPAAGAGTRSGSAIPNCLRCRRRLCCRRGLRHLPSRRRRGAARNARGARHQIGDDAEVVRHRVGQRAIAGELEVTGNEYPVETPPRPPRRIGGRAPVRLVGAQPSSRASGRSCRVSSDHEQLKSPSTTSGRRRPPSPLRSASASVSCRTCVRRTTGLKGSRWSDTTSSSIPSHAGIGTVASTNPLVSRHEVPKRSERVDCIGNRLISAVPEASAARRPRLKALCSPRK